MKLKGKAASAGVAIAKVFKLCIPELRVELIEIPQEKILFEVVKFKKSIEVSIHELEQLRDRTSVRLGPDKAQIFEAHLLILQDPELVDQTITLIEDLHQNASYAFHQVTTQFISMFENMEDEYMRERAADIKDVSTRVLLHLQGDSVKDLTSINEEVIIVAHDLTPSETAQLNKIYVKGFATNIGGRTSHSAIMARSMEIPAVTGLGNISEEVSDGDILIIDGSLGYAYTKPTPKEIHEFSLKRKRFVEAQQKLKALIPLEAKTKDGVKVLLEANIGAPSDLDLALQNDAKGIGLFRSEFLYMDALALPTEEQQYQAYKTVLERMGNHLVVIRTLDIGGDKELPYLPFPKEMNPFLGYRAIRLCLDRQDDIFATQVRALLRASAHGKLAIMFPMIATLDEFRQAKAFVLKHKKLLEKEGIPVSKEIQIGLMVEIPSAAILADQFAEEADFFSIGTNDLIQYSFAADRMSEKVSYLYQPLHPAILRLVQMTINGAHQHGKWVGMCGEMAGEVLATPLLLGLGLDAFSMSATSLLNVKQMILNLNQSDSKELVNQALQLDTATEVEKLVRSFLKINKIDIE